MCNVEFGGKKVNSMVSKFSFGCAGQLSRTSAIFSFCYLIAYPSCEGNLQI
jgi:hypothetical protein